jgi:hypothetical protein
MAIPRRVKKGHGFKPSTGPKIGKSRALLSKLLQICLTEAVVPLRLM